MDISDQLLSEAEEKRNQLLVDVLLRITTLENLLVSKGIFTIEEQKTEFKKLTAGLFDLMKKNKAE